MFKTYYNGTDENYKVTESMKKYHGVSDKESSYAVQLLATTKMNKVEVSKLKRKYTGRREDESRLYFDPKMERAMRVTGWEKVKGWCQEPHRIVYKHDKSKAIFTYCEGDLTMQVFTVRQQYNDKLKECEDFYKKY